MAVFLHFHLTVSVVRLGYIRNISVFLPPLFIYKSLHAIAHTSMAVTLLSICLSLQSHAFAMQKPPLWCMQFLFIQRQISNSSSLDLIDFSYSKNVSIKLFKCMQGFLLTVKVAKSINSCLVIIFLVVMPSHKSRNGM